MPPSPIPTTCTTTFDVYKVQSSAVIRKVPKVIQVLTGCILSTHKLCLLIIIIFAFVRNCGYAPVMCLLSTNMWFTSNLLGLYVCYSQPHVQLTLFTILKYIKSVFPTYKS